MSWYNSSWNRRASVTVDNSGGSTTPIDIQFTIPADWDEFWTSVLSTGADLRLVAADGVTLVSNVEFNSFNSTNRTCTVKVDNWTPPGEGMCHLWLYWGNSGASSISVSQTLTSPKGGYIELGAATYRQVSVTPEGFKDVRPRAKIQKTSGESVYVFFDFSGILEGRRSVFAERMFYEEISRISSLQVTIAGANQTTMYSSTEGRVIQGRLVRVLVKAGDDGSDYTIALQVTTTNSQGGSQVLEARTWLAIRNTDEA